MMKKIVSSPLITAAALLISPLSAQGQEITYNSHVANIINENCVVCHREGGIGPMQFENFDQVRPWAPLISLKVASREMPPYAYDHGIGIQDLKGDWRLAQEEIDTIVSWVNSGSPLGPVDIIPPAAALVDLDSWNFEPELGEPDLVVASIPIDIPAGGNDMWHKHYVDTGVTQKRCIKAMQVKPRGDARAVVHHSNPSVDAFNADTGEYERFSQLTEYAMGKWGELMPEIKDGMKIADLIMSIVMLIIWFALSLGIINTMLMSVLERTNELGMLMAIGMSRYKIVSMIFFETSLLTIIGVPIGLMLTIISMDYYGEVGIDLSVADTAISEFGYESIIYPKIKSSFYLQVIYQVVIVSLISTVFPAMRVLKLRPVEAIRKS